MSPPKWMDNAPHSFEKVLVANRGEIACRVIRACSELGLSSVAIFAPNDVNSLFVELADESIILNGESIAETYLNSSLIIQAAFDSGAGAIHPGFGFLSERADFAQDVIDAGLIWIGPSPEAIESMGDKMTARSLMREANVPVIPGVEILETNEKSANSAIHTAAEKVGFPLLLKASAGGGGKGMRSVTTFAELDEAASSARREALSAFGDGRVYVESLLTGSRHIEIQILADKHGTTLHLGERECSIQRRHQKVLEETPSVAISPVLRMQMGKAAIAAAKAVDYVGAGTVEFLLTPQLDYYFLEMNTRIQVEHPITEAVTGVDIVQQQIQISAGLKLDISQENIEMKGHAIEVRLYAEDPASGFLPAIGPLALFQPPEEVWIRLDTGVRQGDEITPEYDPMIAKLIVHAETREKAITHMINALREFIILGTITNLSFLQDLLKHPEFFAGETPTNFIETHWPNGWSEQVEMPLVAYCAAAAEAFGISRKTTLIDDDNGMFRGDRFNPFFRLGRSFP